MIKEVGASCYGITFDGTVTWNFGNDYANDDVIFAVDNSSSSHTDNLNDNF